MLAAIRADGKITIAVASSAIAAQLLMGGTTAHRRFSIPIELSPQSLCSLKSNSASGKTILEAALIIWDEAPMQSRWAIEAVDRSLRLLTEIDKPFGGKIIGFGGDFRQVLPVIPKANRATLVSMIFKRSDLWQSIHQLKLTINERVQRCGNNAESRQFSEFLLNIGEGKVTVDRDIGENSILIPNEYLFQSCSISDFITWCYPSFDFSHHSNNFGTAILAPKNDDVDELNDIAVDMFPGEKVVLLSGDSIKAQDSDNEKINFPEEFLNTLTPNGFPLHKLTLKKNCPVILLRNLSVREGLCNGTRLVVKNISPRVLNCLIVTGGHKDKEVLIPRVSLDTNTGTYPFIMKRRQFPVRLAFAMTINKAQGQTLKKVGIYLSEPVFGHGQLYVALSPSGEQDNTKLFIRNVKNNQGNLFHKPGWYSDNIVYNEVLN